MICSKELPSGVIATWSEVVRTEMDYNAKTSRATVYYYIDEKAFTDGKEPVLGEVIDVPFVEQEELMKEDVTAKIMAETVVSAKMEEKPMESFDIVEEVV